MQTNLYKEFKQFIQGIKKQNNNKNADFEPGEKDPLRQLGEKKNLLIKNQMGLFPLESDKLKEMNPVDHEIQKIQYTFTTII